MISKWAWFTQIRVFLLLTEYIYRHGADVADEKADFIPIVTVLRAWPLLKDT